jgi:rhamnogalacturonan endolyase
MRFKASLLAGLMAAAAAAQAAPADCTQWGQRGELLYQDDFSGPLKGYVTEYAKKPGNVIADRDGRLLIDVDSGATVWLDKRLSGNVLITYTRRVEMGGGKHDRVSDFNHFWMASDPHNPRLFTRSGKFEDYDNLDMYYVGFGGNTNSTTRFRRYEDGKRVVLGEYRDAAHLLKPNRDYAVEIAVYNGCTRMLVDGKEFFSYRDPHPFTSGYFGFRTTWSRQTIDNLKIYQLK